MVSQNYGFFFGGPHNKDYSILGFILGSPNFRETARCCCLVEVSKKACCANYSQTVSRSNCLNHT